MPTSQEFRDLEERLSGLDSNRVAGLQRVYFFTGSGLVFAALLASVAIDVLHGDAADAIRVGCLIFLLALVIAAGSKLRSKPHPLYRSLLAAGLVLVTYEACIGTNAGFSFLWFYVFPIPCYFLLGRREARVWIAAVVLILAWLLFGADPHIFPGGHPGLNALISLALLGLLAHGLDTTRENLAEAFVEESQALQRTRVDVHDLRGLIPLCARCRSPRNDVTYRDQVTSYLARSSPAELIAAQCPNCVDGTDTTSGGPVDDTAAFRFEDLWIGSHGARHNRRRRLYFTVGMLSLLPLMGYLTVSDLLQGRLVDAGVTFFLAGVFAATLLVLQRRRHDTWLYQAGLAAILLTLGYDLYAGSFGGFAALWFYVIPMLALLVSGTAGLVWTLLASLICGVFLLTPIGYTYPIDMAWRFFATFALTSIMSFWLERLRQRSQTDLEDERLAVHAALDERQTLLALLPVCPACRLERADTAFWERVEASMSEASSARFRRGLCRVCAEKGAETN